MDWLHDAHNWQIKLHQNHTQLRFLLRSEFGLLFQWGHNLTPVRRNVSNHHQVQLSCWNRPSVKTPSEFSCVECMQTHYSYLNGKTSEVQMNPLSDVMLMWLCMQVYVYNTKWCVYIVCERFTGRYHALSKTQYYFLRDIFRFCK